MRLAQLAKVVEWVGTQTVVLVVGFAEVFGVGIVHAE